MPFILGGGKTWSKADHCSERQTGRWTNCLPCTLIMLARAKLVDVPSINAEAQKLRLAAGYPSAGPTGLTKMRLPFKAMFGFFYELDQPHDPMLLLQPGFAGSVTGSMKAFPAGHTLRRHDPPFADFHQWFAAHLPDGRVLIDDPLAPEGGYDGQIISKDQLRAFYEAGGSVRRIAVVEAGRPEVKPKPVPAGQPVPPPVATPPPAPDPLVLANAAYNAALDDVAKAIAGIPRR